MTGTHGRKSWYFLSGSEFRSSHCPSVVCAFSPTTVLGLLDLQTELVIISVMFIIISLIWTSCPSTRTQHCIFLVTAALLVC